MALKFRHYVVRSVAFYRLCTRFWLGWLNDQTYVHGKTFKQNVEAAKRSNELFNAMLDENV